MKIIEEYFQWTGRQRDEYLGKSTVLMMKTNEWINIVVPEGNLFTPYTWEQIWIYRIIYESISVLDSSQMQFQSENGEWIHSFLSKILHPFSNSEWRMGAASTSGPYFVGYSYIICSWVLFAV